MKTYENFTNKIIFVRFERFDNDSTVRELPYKGIHCWAIYEKDFDKYIKELELWGGNRKYVKILEPKDKIYALNYKQSHKYVMGEDDKLPELETFNPDKHVMKFIKQTGKSMLEYCADMKYQIIC